VQAKRALDASDMKKRHKRSHIDEASAVVILQAYLDKR
jgi:RNase H-fold protein (predicted Holliday junction resolvase)